MPGKPKDFKELLKNLFESKNKRVLIGALVICVCLIGIILLSKHFKNAEEQELYMRVLRKLLLMNMGTISNHCKPFTFIGIWKNSHRMKTTHMTMIQGTIYIFHMT